MTSDGEGTRHQRPLDQIKEFHERLALLQRAYDALSERLSDQRLAIAESWEEREKEWGEKVRLSEAERETLTADLARAASDAAARSEALTESERRVAELLEEGASLRAQLAAEAERREEAEKGLRSAAVESERRVAELLEESTSLRAQLAAESSRRTAAEDASRSAGAAKEDAARRAEAAETEMRRIAEEAAALRAELEQLRPDHEQLAKFHAMVLTEVDALLNDKRVLTSRLAEVEAEGDAARQNAERVSAAQAAQLAQVRAEYDVLHSEFVRFTHLRLFRYTAPLRTVYGQVRRLLGLRRP
jgi:chromosome segregation ATPase